MTHEEYLRAVDNEIGCLPGIFGLSYSVSHHSLRKKAGFEMGLVQFPSFPRVPSWGPNMYKY